MATDLDGTIVRSDGTISPRTRAALAAAEQAGAMVVIVTGRPPRWLDGIAEQTGHRGLAICANGALVWDLHREEVVASHPFDVDVVREIAEALRAELPDLGFAVETVTAGFAHEPTYVPRWSLDPQTVVAELEALLSEPVAKLLARHEGLTADELLRRAREVVGSDLASLTHSSRDGLLEISAAGVTKASTLTTVCADHGYTAADVVAFGDMPNDLPMLAWAGRGVAVANAHPTVLDAVDEVTAANDEDGVALVLERWFG
ncbi:MAG TPA: HAD family hydrolase [Mycobacteriales bacterium]|nr:HAD family hydrolase [Mycobacteriales bacterium]